MLKLTVLVGNKKLVEVEGVIYFALLSRKVKPFFNLFTNHARKLIGVHLHFGQHFIGVIIFAIPICLGFLLVGIRPVEYLLVGKLFARQLLERRT